MFNKGLDLTFFVLLVLETFGLVNIYFGDFLSGVFCVLLPIVEPSWVFCGTHYYDSKCDYEGMYFDLEVEPKGFWMVSICTLFIIKDARSPLLIKIFLARYRCLCLKSDMI